MIIFISGSAFSVPLLIELLLHFFLVFLEGLWDCFDYHLRDIMAEGAMTIGNDYEPLIFLFLIFFFDWVHIHICACDLCAYFVDAK